MTIIAMTYLIPVTVYVDVEGRRISQVCVDNSAEFENGRLEHVENHDQGYIAAEDLSDEAATKAIALATEIQGETDDWPAWRFRY